MSAAGPSRSHRVIIRRHSAVHYFLHSVASSCAVRLSLPPSLPPCQRVALYAFEPSRKRNPHCIDRSTGWKMSAVSISMTARIHHAFMRWNVAYSIICDHYLSPGHRLLSIMPASCRSVPASFPDRFSVPEEYQGKPVCGHDRQSCAWPGNDASIGVRTGP